MAGLREADSTEVAEDATHKIIYKLRDRRRRRHGRTMRLGSYACKLELIRCIQGLRRGDISTNGTATGEFNCLYEQPLVERGLRIVGRSLDGKFVEIVELPGHPWFLAVQFHPEFKSKPLRPHPLFAGFIEAAYKRKMSLQGIATNVTAIGDRRRG